MAKKILNEKKYVENLIENMDTYPDRYDMYLIACYYRDLKPAKIKQKIYEIVANKRGEDPETGFFRNVCYEAVNDAVDSSRKTKHEITTCDDVKINVEWFRDKTKQYFDLYVEYMLNKACGRSEPLKVYTDKKYKKTDDIDFWSAPVFVQGTAEQRTVEIFIHGKTLENYNNGWRPDLIMADRWFKDKIVIPWFVLDVPEGDVVVDPDYLNNNREEIWRNVVKDGATIVNCKHCGKIVYTKSKNKKQGCTCPECRKKLDRERKKKDV